MKADNKKIYSFEKTVDIIPFILREIEREREWERKRLRSSIALSLKEYKSREWINLNGMWDSRRLPYIHWERPSQNCGMCKTERESQNPMYVITIVIANDSHVSFNYYDLFNGKEVSLIFAFKSNNLSREDQKRDKNAISFYFWTFYFDNLNRNQLIRADDAQTTIILEGRTRSCMISSNF